MKYKNWEQLEKSLLTENNLDELGWNKLFDKGGIIEVPTKLERQVRIIANAYCMRRLRWNYQDNFIQNPIDFNFTLKFI